MQKTKLVLGKKIISYFLILLFLGYYINVSLFQHTHIVNGVTVVHSHIFDFTTDTSDGHNHKHNESELRLIQLLSNFAVVLLLFTCCIRVFSVFQKELKNFRIDIIFNKFRLLYFSLRAPPISF